jgi:hypothetical protein
MAMTTPSRGLSEEQRRALKLLLHTSPHGCNKTVLLARGFKVEMLSGLVRDGFANIEPRPVQAGARSVTAIWLTITDTGRRALAG